MTGESRSQISSHGKALWHRPSITAGQLHQRVMAGLGPATHVFPRDASNVAGLCRP